MLFINFELSCILGIVILEHKRRVQESLLILTTYTTYHSRSIRRIQDVDELKDHCLTLKNTSYSHQRYDVYNTLVNEEEQAGFTKYVWIRSSDDVMDLEVSSARSSEPSRSRGTDLEMDVDVERSDEPHSEPVIDPVKAVIEACFNFADIISGNGIDVRVEFVTVARDEDETGARGTVMVSDDGDTHPMVLNDIPEPA
ncbi:hypothetical protein Tco_0705742 [Tanacetum coccineum]|uniref:Uncharacterized protein n=1 Tax=Tanacetum coccineum TaxID=301880 RepID=A0ABQ4Y700_9ASTR